MKRALTILFALAAVACSKTDIAFESVQGTEMTFTPISGNLTKAAVTNTIFPVDNHISLYAYYSPDVVSGQVDDYSAFTKKYFENTEFYCKDQANKKWGGLTPYYWPTTGSMVFAGYSLNKPVGAANTASEQNGTPAYELAKDRLTITGYKQSNLTSKTYDLLYFGRTDESYDRHDLTVPVVFKHALSWIEIYVKGGVGALVDGHTWAITNVEFKEVATIGDFKYTGTETDESKKAVWSNQVTPANVVVFNSDKTAIPAKPAQRLTASDVKIETVNAGTVVIPQAAKYLYVTIEYLSPANDLITEVVKVDIPSRTANWEAGKKYTYYLTFSPEEILIAPSVEAWPDPINTDLDSDDYYQNN